MRTKNKYRFVTIGDKHSTIVSNLAISLSENSTNMFFEWSNDIIEPNSTHMLKDGTYKDEYFIQLIRKYVKKRNYDELIISVTDYPLYDELFYTGYPDVVLISLANWNNFSKYPITKGLKYIVADAILNFFVDVSAHEDKTYGCPSDFCDNLSDIDFGIEKSEYCSKCKPLIASAVEQNKLPLSTLAVINGLLDDVADRMRCFVLIPFDETFNSVYSTIKEIASTQGYLCDRDSENSEHANILDTIVEMIMRSDYIIADLSNKNPNVLYELGYAHALGKKTIIITQHAEDIPFDLRFRRYIQYQNSTDLSKKLIGQLPKQLTYSKYTI